MPNTEPLRNILQPSYS